MFLKFLDDLELVREEEALLSGKRYAPLIEALYRWRDWAAKEDGITGDELISFVNNEEAVRPDGTKGPGLFAYLRSLRSADGQGDRREIAASDLRSKLRGRHETQLLSQNISPLLTLNVHDPFFGALLRRAAPWRRSRGEWRSLRRRGLLYWRAGRRCRRWCRPESPGTGRRRAA
jgi:hypothetical protein